MLDQRICSDTRPGTLAGLAHVKGHGPIIPTSTSVQLCYRLADIVFELGAASLPRSFLCYPFWATKIATTLLNVFFSKAIIAFFPKHCMRLLDMEALRICPIRSRVHTQVDSIVKAPRVRMGSSLRILWWPLLRGVRADIFNSLRKTTDAHVGQLAEC